MKGIEITDGITNKMMMGHKYPVKLTVDLKGLTCDDVGCELVITESENGEKEKIVATLEFEAQDCEDNLCSFKHIIKPDHPGSFSYSFRLFAKNEHLAHRQDFRYIKWIN
ncbi:MAG: hypothetical protein R3182_00490 [Draconibacterium sp.]|nr:hypothetical protein [Draconibacterium sp.]